MTVQKRWNNEKTIRTFFYSPTQDCIDWLHSNRELHSFHRESDQKSENSLMDCLPLLKLTETESFHWQSGPVNDPKCVPYNTKKNTGRSLVI